MELNHYQRDVNSSSDGVSRPKKQRRISRACDFCHRRSIRCRPAQGSGNRCQNCLDFDIDCTFIRPSMRRGTKLKPTPNSQHCESPSSKHANPLLHLTNTQINQSEATYGASQESAESGLKLQFSIELSEDHKELVLKNLAKIQDLVTVYFEVVYPM